jgi:hypothetical protein
MPEPEHVSFNVDSDSDRWRETQVAWKKIARMYWGPRIELMDACAAIRVFLASLPTP